MSYPETIAWLYSVRRFGVKLGLENVRRLLARLDDPHRSLRFIHIAGTNGKGSVAAMLASIYEHGGMRTGLYTSPHLVSFCERIQINRQPISEAGVVRWSNRIRAEIPALEQEGHPHPTFFEIVTALALLHFREHRVEMVIWETGMGGRLDATNIVQPLVSVITNVDWDHQQYLGNTLEAIAREKAGIIKPGVPVVTAAIEPLVARVIETTSRQLQARVVWVGRDITAQPRSEGPDGQVLELRGCARQYGPLRVPLPGLHQATNAATSVAAMEAAGGCLPDNVRDRRGGAEADPPRLPSVQAVCDGLADTRWPGRFQYFGNLRPPVLLDGAHNVGGARVLRETLCRLLPSARPILLLGALADKDCSALCAELVPLASAVLTVRVKNDRSSQPEELARLCRQFHPQARVEASEELPVAYVRARQLAGDDPRAVLLITGSLFLVGEALQNLPLGQARGGANPTELTLQEKGAIP